MLHSLACRIAAGLACCFVASAARAQPAATVFCLSDGSRLSAERFEAKEGKFLLYSAGSATPKEVSAANVCSVNVEPCNCSAQRLDVRPTPIGDATHFGIYGSNTIGERLMPALIDVFARKNFQQAPMTRLGKPEEMEITLRAGAETKAVIDFQSHGSGTAEPALISGKAAIGMASRQLKKDEAEALRARFGVDAFAAENEHVLALDGLAIIVNPDNPVQKLTLEQIGRMFSGAVANWSEVGGPDLPVTVYRRDDKSGTYDTFKSLVLDPAGLKISPEAKKFESSELLVEAASKDPGGIGFIALPYVGKGNRALNIATACGLTSAPTRFSVKSEEYPLARRLFLYTIGQPAAPVARDLLQFSLSDEAAATVSDAEFINLSVEFENADEQKAWASAIASNPSAGLGSGNPVPAPAAKFFRQSMADMRRLSMEFRFLQGSAQLDTRALQDIARLGRYLAEPAMAKKQFYIVGFADADGGWKRNSVLALRRAEAVADLLKAKVPVARDSVKSLSYMAPVDCNDSEPGKAKNRRVEVWIKDR